ncbi:putative GCN5-related N-acetyltransferase [Actinoplanes missouriensis 431]|uniref:Putative GCN5-related N-acetyltransferase n=1 Tax=Actinoplanes missouriensis (strain ATCC 14538 / DSM 43046 / CBS 188.64 / JCM 3121 / NBRC 102363 / NCIMB 12654 / NRRL B-3342 / UNCC 431) TaxID=512565 RepID=I0H832_ACTM4|nr:GNAT family N-acetyltransferase [Actinoplanes missouriensis]BAL89169.1 putative GCN5-related N-acetyltransferase [Actinoplanes missouriensis 431]
MSLRRADQPGDLDWIVTAHGEVYESQFGWDTSFRKLVAEIVADFAATCDPSREAAWIAEADGRRAGCVMLVAGAEPGVAQLRVLLVTGAARGLGLGGKLVAECLAFAREAGYRRVTLWTVDECVSARRIYEGVGFTLTAEEPHPGFGHPLTGQTWTLDL